MKNMYWAIATIFVVIILAEGYALYQIPKSSQIQGELTASEQFTLPKDSVYKVSLTSRAQGQGSYSIVSASELKSITALPHTFTLPVLNSVLSKSGIYQIQAEIFSQQKLIYSNSKQLPLTYKELSSEQQVLMKKYQPQKAPAMQLVEKKTQDPTPAKKAAVQPKPIDVAKLLDAKTWVLDSQVQNKPQLIFDMKKNKVSGNGGCNEFQGGYLVEQSKLVFNNFIATAKQCSQEMKSEADFFDALAEVSSWQVKDKKLLLFNQKEQLLLSFSE